MKLTSRTAGIAVVAAAGFLLAGAGIADTMGQMGGQMGGKMGGPMMGPFPDLTEMDADKDGKISKAEVEAHHAARLAEIDTDKDGKLSSAELAAMHLRIMTERADTMAARMIERLDSDGDGLLSVEELADRPMQGKLFDRVDANEDGFLDQAEIDAAMAKMKERMGHGRHGGHGGMGDHDGGWMDGGDD